MNKKKFLISSLGFVFFSTPVLADGQSVPINYDSLSFLEEPLAVEVGPTTLSTNILLDQSVQYNTTSEEDTYNTRVNGDFLVQTQLPNSWHVKANYIANYNRLADDEYTDNAALSISDEWGTLAGGNVTGSVYEKTRRQRGVGNAVLSNDNFLGGLDETGGFYSVRYNSYELSITADQEGRAEVGVSFERPIGQSSYFTSARIRKGDTSENSSIANDADSLGGAIVGEYRYGSFLIDGQVGYEHIDHGNISSEDDHIFGSLGTQYKSGAYSFSIEGGLGRYNDDEHRSASLGSRIDIARGASLNFGVNYTFSNDHDDTSALGSIRYEF